MNRTIKATDLIVALRCILGLAPLDRPPSDDIPAHLPVTLTVHALHARWWLAWCVAGLDLCSRRDRPTMAAAILTARRTLATMAIDDDVGKLGPAARAILYVRKQVVSEDGTVVTTATLRVTYKQDWPHYNAAQVNEKAAVERLLGGLCEGIVQPPYRGRGRRPLPLADIVYGLTMKVYTGMSGRRASTDIHRCKDSGFMDAEPAYNTLFTAIKSPALTPVLTSMVEASAAPLAVLERDFSIDATGFATTTYDRWFDVRWGKQQKRQRWVKAHAMIGNETNVITAIKVTHGDANDCPELPDLLARTRQRFTIEEMSADKAYFSRVNIDAIATAGAVPYIPFKAGVKGEGSAAWRKMWLTFQLHQEDFLRHYHRRSNVEATFAALKRLTGPSVRSKRFAGQQNEVIAKALVYNLTVVARAAREFGISPEF